MFHRPQEDAAALASTRQKSKANLSGSIEVVNGIVDSWRVGEPAHARPSPRQWIFFLYRPLLDIMLHYVLQSCTMEEEIIIFPFARGSCVELPGIVCCMPRVCLDMMAPGPLSSPCGKHRLTRAS